MIVTGYDCRWTIQPGDFEKVKETNMPFGVFQDMVAVVNRAPIPLQVTFDGQTTTIPSGPGFLPSVTIGYAKNQNPVMGSIDPNNPSQSGGEYLIAVPGKDAPEKCGMLSEAEWNAHCDAISRVDLKVLLEDELGPGERVEVRGKSRKTAARSLGDTYVKGRVMQGRSQGAGMADRTD